MDNQTRKDLERVQSILDQRIYELEYGDDCAFRSDPLPRLKGTFWKRLPLTFLLMVTKAILLTGKTTESSDTHPQEVLRV